MFRRLYVCFKGLKEGWKKGCRRLIGLDACFLKGPVEGQLFVIVGKDGNGQMFPIAWEVTAQESNNTWTKFIKTLQSDLDLGKGEGLIIMFDMHFGLRAAVRNELPEVEHRFCARHIYANWAKTWRGTEKRHKFWACVWSTFQVQLKDNMDELGKLGDATIFEDFLDYGKETFCKAFFRTDVQCDVCENNMCETFYSWIKTTRHKAIITMLEDIRKQVMDRIRKINHFATTWICDIAPMALHRLEKNKERAMHCNRGFETQDGDYGHTIDLRVNTCTCRSWQLKGIPCAHAICAMNHLKINPDDHVLHWHKKETYLRAYSCPIQPILGMKMWPPSNHPPVVPPEIRKKRGRKKINRRKPRDEPKKAGNLSRRGAVMTCFVCKLEGHNKRGCPQQKGHNKRGCHSTSVGTFGSPRGQTKSGGSSRTPRRQQNHGGQGSSGTPRRQQNHGGQGSSGGQAGGKRTQCDSEGAITSQKKGRMVGIGVYMNPTTGLTILNPRHATNRILRCPKPTKHGGEVVDLGSKGKGLKWQGKPAITTRQLSKEGNLDPAIQ